ncbi:gamma-glutamylcyclotransferase [Actinocrinis puniceicyclus]|uniref:Gamma-glutamylcyclotransferase n=1 Tax=Actinocrinis puniceicyclus TaxID=977794 RepID=A0A8J7WM94_9ACTN|nr:gamma-glutamylcyclotransferase [Actinocrinis puniceicyclus]MBS2964993.1 gamma-glutamylcyclotransferase [Actinocrinis puniceicyclus]
MPLMFFNGAAMRGGPLHHLLAGARFVGPVRTAPRYRFYSAEDRYPALAQITGPMGPRRTANPQAAAGEQPAGVSVLGELYDVPWPVLRDALLPAEPAGLELGVIELEDGSGCLSMIRRRAYAEPPGLYRDISDHADWRSHTAPPASAGPSEE